MRHMNAWNSTRAPRRLRNGMNYSISVTLMPGHALEMYRKFENKAKNWWLFAIFSSLMMGGIAHHHVPSAVMCDSHA